MKTSEPGTLPLSCSLKAGHKTTAAIVLALLALAFLSVNASAATRSWTGVSGRWDDPLSWSGTAVPTSADTALIDNGGTALLPTGVSGTTGMIITGSAGTGSLSIDGGVLNVSQNNYSALIGYEPSGSGTATVSSGTWSINGTNGILSVGYSGTGTLNISGGSVSNTGSGLIGFSTGSEGTVTITGGTWNTVNYITVGREGTGTLTVSGGLVSNNSVGFIGFTAGSEGTATVSSGTWSNNGYLAVGLYAKGTLNVSGGFVSNVDSYIGTYAGSEGTATVSSGTWTNGGSLYVGNFGTGVLNLTDTGNVTVNNGAGTVIIASGTGSSGTLNVGTGGTAGTLNADFVTGGSGAATLNFNHTGTHTFAPNLTGNLSVNKLAGGTTILTGSNNYTGPTNINAGTLILSGSGSTGTGATTVNDGGTLGGDGTVQGDLVVQSGGTVAPGLSPGILNANGNAGFNGDATLSIELSGAVKGQDRLAVSGTTTLSGSCKLQLAFLGEADPADLITSGTYTILSSGSLSGTFGTVTDLGVYDDGGGVTYSGTSVDLVLTKDLLGGDANLDGTTNGLDLNILGGTWLGSGDWEGGDFNGDGVVNGLDLNILGGEWLSVASSGESSGGGGSGFVSAIPEPGSLALVFLGGATLAGLRRRACPITQGKTPL